MFFFFLRYYSFISFCLSKPHEILTCFTKYKIITCSDILLFLFLLFSSLPSFFLLRCFCVDCLDLLVGAGASNSARDLDPWLCYMCQPLQQYGVLKRRHDWSLKLQEFFVNDNGQEFVSPEHNNNSLSITLIIFECSSAK